MSILTAFFIYLLIWWVMLFTVLPLGVRRHEEQGKGFDAGAPAKADLKRKLMINTILSAVILAIIWLLVHFNIIRWSEWFSQEAQAEVMPECELVVMHKPAEDVAFKPGLDVTGKPVVEADLTQPLNAQVKDIEIPITIDIAQSLGLAIPAGMETKATVGVIKMKADGTATFNDAPLNLGPEQALITVCEDADENAPAAKENSKEKTGVTP